MAIHIIIDGYNLIRQSEHLRRIDQQDMQRGREALLEVLAAYRKVKSHQITIVFDGTQAPVFAQQRDHRRGIAIRFSRRAETADTVIKRLAKSEREKALVVSSDRDVVESAIRYGAAAVDTATFEKRIGLAAASIGPESASQESAGWQPTTRKRGPSRRLPKKRRKQRAKLNKL